MFFLSIAATCAGFSVYITSFKKTLMQSLCNNFGKYGSIFIILSLLHSEMKKLTQSLPTHLKSVATTVQVNQFKNVQNHLLTVNVIIISIRNVTFLITHTLCLYTV